MTIRRPHTLAAFAAAFAGVLAGIALLAAGCGKTVDRQGDALKAVTAWTQDLENRDYGTACSLYAKAVLGTKGATVAGVKFTPLQTCALGLENNEAQTFLFGSTFYDHFKIDPQPVTDAPATPTNGYVFHVTYASGSILVAVQRNSEGAWKIVGIVTAA